jgi:NAD(P)-dependent dehydrogenase (short-subunit alcohol dehydrogenase family)
MDELRFDGRVAVVTGGARGLGRAYALLLASRGARVVINDTGVGRDGSDPDAHPAQETVREISAAGGRAVACTDSVTTPAGAQAIVNTAIDAFGRIDILIHSAGIVRWGSLTELSPQDFDAVMDVHLRGAFNVVRCAFPHMSNAGYGRIVLTSSIVGLYGDTRLANYGAAKAGTIGLANVVAREGASINVKCNVILPGAVTRMAEGRDITEYPATMAPAMVAPTVAWLSHESCSITAAMLISMGGRVARAFIAETPGVCRNSWTIEDVAQEMDAIQNPDKPLIFSPVPAGHDEHIHFSFAMRDACK